MPLKHLACAMRLIAVFSDVPSLTSGEGENLLADLLLKFEVATCVLFKSQCSCKTLCLKLYQRLGKGETGRKG